MKRQAQVVGANKGVFHYSNGMIGTADLPEMIAEFAHRKVRMPRGTAFMLRQIKPHVATKAELTFRGKIARAWAHRNVH